jgi:hypothetical protein
MRTWTVAACIPYYQLYFVGTGYRGNFFESFGSGTHFQYCAPSQNFQFAFDGLSADAKTQRFSKDFL